MFVTEHVPVRIANLAHRQMEHDQKEVALVDITCEINPLTPKLAAELDDFVRATLYTRTDSEVTSKLKSASFTLPLLPQAITFRNAPDQVKESFTLLETKITSIKAKRGKKSTAWTLVFVATCSPASDKQLGQIVDGYLKTRYLSFENATATLFDETEKEQRRSRGSAAMEAASEPATAH